MGLLHHIGARRREAHPSGPESTELSAAQTQTLATIRAFEPKADVLLHHKPGGVLVELRRGHRARAAFIDDAGTFVPDAQVTPERRAS
jgi:hypothetical protein